MINYDGNKFINFRPVLIVAAIFAVGILLPILSIVVSGLAFAFIFAFTTLIITLIAIWRYKREKAVAVATFIIAAAFFFFGSAVTFSRIRYNDNADFSGYVNFSGYVSDVSYKEFEGYKTVYCIVTVGNINGKTEKVYAKITTNEDVTVYKQIKFNGYVSRFSYLSYDGKINTYTITENIRYIANGIDFVDIGEPISGAIPALRNETLKTLKFAMPSTYHVSYALLTGETSLIDVGELSNFRQIGIAHIFAVSGLHVGFLYKAIELLLSKLKLSKKKIFFVITPILFAYVGLCGFTASCLRAFGIITVHGFARSFGFKFDTLNTLCGSMIIVLLINPTSILTVGFLLSYLAYASLVIFSKPLSNLLSKFLPKKFSDFISSYLVAFLATMPICLDVFGYLSPFSILFNILIVPIIGIVYVLTFVGCFVTMVFNFLSVTCFPAEIATAIICKFVNALESSEFLITNLRFGASEIFYYAAFVSLTDKFNITKKERVTAFLTIFLLFVIAFIIINAAILS